MIAEEAILSAARVLFTTEVNTALAQIEEEEADEVRCPNLEAHTGFGVHPDHPGSFKLSIADVETEEKDRIIRFDGVSWVRMDPTFAAGNSSRDILDYIGDGEHYNEMYIY